MTDERLREGDMSKWPRMTEERVSELVRLSVDDFMVEAEAEIRAGWADRDRLAAEVERLKYRLFFIDIEAGALQEALSRLVRQVEDSGIHQATCVCTRYDTDDLPEGAECECFDPAMEEALAALAGSAGRRALAQIAAGRALAEAIRAYDPKDAQGYGLYDALAAWDRAAAEGGVK